MVNFILNENDTEKRSFLEVIILNFIGTREEKFKIQRFDTYKPNDNNEDIYILSTNTITEAIKISTNIRKRDNWNSQIIIISNLKSIKPKELINNLLILDYIDIDSNITERLKKTLYIGYKLVTKDKSLVFSYNGEINKVLYNSILYIEKGNNQNYCTIHAIGKEYIIKTTINKLENQLDGTYFLKVHRSCIINIYNIKNYNYSKNVITLKNNKKCYLIARDKRKILKEKLTKTKKIKDT
jgi:hypothetical protein